MGNASRTEAASLRAEIEVLREEVARVDQRTSARIDDLILVVAGGLMFIIAATLVGVVVGGAS
jgi:hypothetical protein